MKLMRLEEGTGRMTEAEKLLEQCGFTRVPDDRFLKNVNAQFVKYENQGDDVIDFVKWSSDKEWSVSICNRYDDLPFEITENLAGAIYAMLKELNGAE